LDAAGVGELVHPYYGRRKVMATEYRINESTDAGGMAKFSITFVEAGENNQPAARADTTQSVLNRADQAQVVVQEDFGKTFSVIGMPEFVSAAGVGDVTKAIDSLAIAARSTVPNMSMLPEYNLALNGLANSVTNLVRTPQILSSLIFGQVSGLQALATGPQNAFNNLAGLFDFGDPNSMTALGTGFVSVPTTTPARIAQAANQQAVIGLTRQAALIEAARVSSTVEFVSYDDAIAMRDDLANRLEAEAETASDPVYRALTDLRVAVIRDISTRGADLARIVQYTPTATQPSLVLAYQLYGDDDPVIRAGEIAARNNIRRPGFVAGGQAIEVLT
ncbi:MAG: hypothetical protein AAB658_11685, partial [Chloroflexota bacterium]